MKIDLIIGGETKTFSSPFISARVLKDTIAKANSIKEIDETLIDEMVDYIVKVYGNQFTADDLLDGIASDQIIPTFQNTLDTVTGDLDKKLVPLKDPNARKGKK